MDIIKITAQFVAKNGEKFLSELSQRESKNSQFNFLKPQHILFGYFTYLVGSYTKIITDKKEKIKNTTLTENGIKRLNRNKRICRNF